MSEPQEWTQEQAVALANELYPYDEGDEPVFGFVASWGNCCIGVKGNFIHPGMLEIPPDILGQGGTWREAALDVARNHVRNSVAARQDFDARVIQQAQGMLREREVGR